ncbi:alpha/beta hydrolase [Kineococcus sp. SYSU DK005]|uniref:alpha/beta hydrolase n=1 Tax=Kineococcus sp. SYSU DK005 TaxID=3383126 RepID=UPI003D7CF3F7
MHQPRRRATPPSQPPAPLPSRPAPGSTGPSARSSARRLPALAALGAAALGATLVTGAGAASAAPAPPAAPPTASLPGTAPLSALATARPATLAEAERQFQQRYPALYREQVPAWAPCAPEAVGSAQAAAALECAEVLVPRDHRDPGAGEPLRIAVSRLPQAGERPARTVLTNPGGPGGAGLSLAGLGLQPALARTEVVGLDVRGTGASTPLTCGADANAAVLGAPDPRDRSPQALSAAAAAMRATADACADDPLVDVVNTEQTIADLDVVRHALGRETVDWVGYSGGTWLGAQYATYFPARVGRFVLDSSVEATAAFQEVFSENQPPAFQRRFEEDFAGWAAGYHWLFRLGPTAGAVEGTYERVRAELAARPLTLDGVPLVDGTLVDGLVVQAMYSKTTFEQLAWILRGLDVVTGLRAGGAQGAADAAGAALAGRVAALLPQRLADERPAAADSFAATFLATTCNDTAWSRGEAFWNDLGQLQGPAHPLRGWASTQQPCGYWDRAPLSLPRPDGRDLPPLLIVQSRHDPATSYEGALATHEALGSSVLVTVEDEGDHALYASAGNPCVDEVVDAFLTTGVAPEQDVTCAGTGVPAPGSQLLSAVQRAVRDAVAP